METIRCLCHCATVAQVCLKLVLNQASRDLLPQLHAGGSVALSYKLSPPSRHRGAKPWRETLSEMQVQGRGLRISTEGRAAILRKILQRTVHTKHMIIAEKEEEDLWLV